MAEKKYRTVMLIDDNEIDNLINQKMIEAASITENIYTHTGAKSAFLDIDMPLMDGFQFLDEFEKLTNTAKKKCKIVMLTSSINPQDFNRSKKYENVKLYLNKPLSHESITKLEV
jgi:CheY-like chemotaxis protein